MIRGKFEARSILLRSPVQVETARALLGNLPLDADKPLEVLIREQSMARGLDQNAGMWAGPLMDIAKQAWVHGKQFSAETWHEYFKILYLPEEFDAELTKDGYRKYDYTPAGDRVLIGSTTGLTIKGFAQYREKLTAFGAGLGVQFSARP